MFTLDDANIHLALRSGCPAKFVLDYIDTRPHTFCCIEAQIALHGFYKFFGKHRHMASMLNGRDTSDAGILSAPAKCRWHF